MKQFILTLFFGGDDVAAEVIAMLGARVAALKHRARRTKLEAKAADIKAQEDFMVDAFKAFRKSVSVKLTEFGE